MPTPSNSTAGLRSVSLQPDMIQGTTWTVIPRGIDGGKARFTVLVTPTLQGAGPDDAGSSRPLSTLWSNWFDTVADVISNSPQFLSISPDTGNPVILTLQGEFPQNPASGKTPQEQQLLFNRRKLWIDLTSILPDHLQTDNAEAAAAAARALGSGFHSTNSHRANSNQGRISKAWEYQHQWRKTDKSFADGNLGQRLFGPKKKEPLTSFALTLESDSTETMTPVTFLGTTKSDLSYAQLYRQSTPIPLDTISEDFQAEVQSWFDTKNPTAAQAFAMQVLRRDFARLVPYDPASKQALVDRIFTTLKSSVICYMYSHCRSTADSTFNLKDKFSALYQEGFPKASFIKAMVFHRRIQPPDGVPKPNPIQLNPRAAGTLLDYGDFLKAMATLQHYPSLLTGLGLAFEATADASSLWPATAARLRVNLSDYATKHLLPVGTQPFTMITGRMYPKDNPVQTDFPVSKGLLEAANYEVLTYDFDVDTMRRHAYAENPVGPAAIAMGAVPGGPVADYDDVTAGLLPLKSAGISIVQRSPGDPTNPVTHATTFLNRLKQQNLLSAKTAVGSADSPCLYAQDFIRGFSMEVGEDAANRVSLTSRTENFSYKQGNATLPLLSEPHIRPFTPVSTEAGFADDKPLDPDSAHDDLILDPHVGSRICGAWEGWSMVMSSPLKSITSPNENPDAEKDAPHNQYPIVPTYTLPSNHLPRLRYGGPGNAEQPACYFIRVRAVDVMGETIAVEIPPADTEKTYDFQSTYQRHDPVLPPEIMVDTYFDPTQHNYGEHIDTVAVRDGKNGTTSTRYFIPQSAPVVDLVEQGAFDQADPHAPLRSPFEIGTFGDVELTAQGQIPKLSIANSPTLTIPVYQLPQHTRPSGTYLPDTYAHSLNIQLRDIPTGLYFGPVEMRSFYALIDGDDAGQKEALTWPAAQHIRAQLLASPYSTTQIHADWSSADVLGPERHKVAQLNIYIPKGWQVEMMVSCAPTRTQAGRMACDAEGKLITEGVDLIANGLSTLQTPTRSITLVHAVTQPQAESCFDNTNTLLAENYQPDSPDIQLSGSLTVGDHRSTGLCIVLLCWDEYVDDPQQDKPYKVQHVQSLVQIPNLPIENWQKQHRSPSEIPEYLTSSLPVRPTIYKFPDGKFRKLSLYVDAVSRYQPFFPPSPSGSTPPSPSDSTSDINSPYVLPKKGQERKSPPLLIAKSNTRMPTDVALSHILPLLPSVPDSLDPKSGYRVYGGAFRIHLKRGWYSSGEGEQLALLMLDDHWVELGNTAWEGDKNLAGLFTRWGLDPRFDSQSLPAKATAAPLISWLKPPKGLPGFSAPVPVELYKKKAQPTDPDPIGIPGTSSLPVPGSPGGQLDAFAVAYTPVFTPQDGWYVDVIVDQVPAYNMFLRLALVRYQANSIVDCTLSRVVLSPFIQLRPERAFRVVRGAVKHQFELGIYGTPIPKAASKPATRFVLTVEIYEAGRWVLDPDTTGKDQNPPERLSNSWDDDPEGGSPSLMQSYLLTVSGHEYRRRRVRVDEAESRTGYDPVTLGDMPSQDFWVSLGDPMEFPR